MKRLNRLIFIIFLFIILAISVFATPRVELLTPNNDSRNCSNNNIIFQCAVSDFTDLTSISLYVWNSTGSLSHNEMVSLGGSLLPISLSEDVYQWNCLAYNNQSEFSWAPSNYTLTVYTPINNATIVKTLLNQVSIFVNDTIQYKINISNVGDIRSNFDK